MSRSKRIWRRIGILATWLLGLIAAIMAVAVVLFYTLSDVPRPEDLPLPQVATIDLLRRIDDGPDRLREPHRCRCRRCPNPVRWACCPREDRNFYSEPGVSITGHHASGPATT